MSDNNIVLVCSVHEDDSSTESNNGQRANKAEETKGFGWPDIKVGYERLIRGDDSWSESAPYTFPYWDMGYDRGFGHGKLI